MKQEDKLVYGVGVNDAGYNIYKYEMKYDAGVRRRVAVWTCPFYFKWKCMLQRCYCAKSKKRLPAYEKASVCKEWLTFSNFKAWMQQQEWEGKELDKDILITGNQEYNPQACVLVLSSTNLFLTNGKGLGKYLTGVKLEKGKFIAHCGNGSGKRVYLGSFKTQEEAHLAWLMFKIKTAREIGRRESDERVAKALVKRYEDRLWELNSKNACTAITDVVESISQIISDRY